MYLLLGLSGAQGVPPPGAIDHLHDAANPPVNANLRADSRAWGQDLGSGSGFSGFTATQWPGPTQPVAVQQSRHVFTI